MARDDLAELLARRAATLDEARTEAVERRHATGARTARENVADLVDPGSFVEYGRLAIMEAHREQVLERLAEIERNLELIDFKIGLYRDRLDLG